MYCLDWDIVGDNVAIWGDPNDEISYQRLEYLLTPCNYLHAEFGPTNDTIPKECNSTRQAQIDYLGNMRMVVYTDEQLFQLNDFSVGYSKKSRFFTAQVDQTKPTWFDGRFLKNYIEDETSLLQYGQFDENYFYGFSMS